MRLAITLALVLAVAAVSAQQVSVDPERPPPAGGARRMARNVIGANGRKLTVAAGSGTRKLLGYDGATITYDPAIEPFIYSQTGAMCTATNTTFETLVSPYEFYGELLQDNAVCARPTGRGRVVTTGAASGALYGAAAQDFGSARPNWETYGWALFKTDDLTSLPDKDRVEIQGIQLHVIGNVGRGHSGGATCSVKAVSVAIFNAGQTSPFNPTTTAVVNVTVSLPRTAGGGTTFSWSSNTSAILYTDIVDDLDAARRHQLLPNTFYWLRVKYHVDYAGTGGGQCFAFWGMSSAYATGFTSTQRARWQERTGGSAGYSTTCLGASASGLSVPGQHQTFWNCWNNGISSSASPNYRRCLTYRNMMVPALATADCTSGGAQFNDFNYAFTGFLGFSGGGGSP